MYKLFKGIPNIKSYDYESVNNVLDRYYFEYNNPNWKTDNSTDRRGSKVHYKHYSREDFTRNYAYRGW